ncbi:MAG TPA: hypothetical protein PLJ34_01085 [Hyphomicrobiales bacterium]|nr:hypothetical protein [Hyphomicrobiales bacterium]
MKLLAATLTALFLVSTGPVLADSIKPRPEGGDCGVMLGQMPAESIWWGRYAGARTGHNCDWCEESISVEACFTSETDCQNWLYWTRSGYPDRTRVAGCSLGYGGYRKH